MTDGSQMNELVRDALGEIANIAGGIATTELDKLFTSEIRLNIMGQKLQLDLNMTGFLTLTELNNLMSTKEEIILISSPMKTRDLEGDITITFSSKSALLISSLLEQKRGFYEMIGEEDQLALKRIGQVLLDSYLSEFSSFLELPTTHSESKMFVMAPDKVIKFLREKVDKRVQNTIIFQTKFQIPKTEIVGEFELMCTLKDLNPVIKGIERKLGMGVDEHGIKQTDYLKLKDGTEIKDVDDLTNALKKMDDATFITYVDSMKNPFADWLGKIYKSEEMAERMRPRRTRNEMISALSKEKDRLSAKEKEKGEDQKLEDTIQLVREDYNSLKELMSEMRKTGKDVTYQEMTLERVPAKIKLAEATRSLEDVQKVQTLISEIKKQLASAV